MCQPFFLSKSWTKVCTKPLQIKPLYPKAKRYAPAPGGRTRVPAPQSWTKAASDHFHPSPVPAPSVTLRYHRKSHRRRFRRSQHPCCSNHHESHRSSPTGSRQHCPKGHEFRRISPAGSHRRVSGGGKAGVGAGAGQRSALPALRLKWARLPLPGRTGAGRAKGDRRCRI